MKREIRALRSCGGEQHPENGFSPPRLVARLLMLSIALLMLSAGVASAQTTQMPCRNCHVSGDTMNKHHSMAGVVAGDSSTCTRCHTGVSVDGKCSTCHTKTGLANPMHALPLAKNGQCNICHTGAQIDPANCKNCHDGAVRVPHHNLAKAGWKCISCHESASVPSGGCPNCHKPWKNGNPHHMTIWAFNNECTHCHTIVVNAGVTQLMIKTCPECHLAPGQPPISDRHHGTPLAVQGLCKSCHSGSTTLLYNGCPTCHWNRNHHGTTWAQSGDCKHCHVSIVVNTDSCPMCHVGPIRTIHHGTPLQQVNGDCGFCHKGVSTPSSCANCHTVVPHHNSVSAQVGDCAHCHVPPAFAQDAPEQAACKHCHKGYQHTRGAQVSDKIQDFRICFGCHSKTPYHGKPATAPSWFAIDGSRSAPGRGAFNLFVSQFRRGESLGKPLYGNQSEARKIQNSKWVQPSLNYTMKTISHNGNSYQVPSLLGGVITTNPAPVITLRSPKPGNSVSGMVGIHVDAGDNGTIAKVEYKINGDPWIKMTGPDNTASGSWTAVWDSTKVGLGSHLIQVQATDNQGAFSSASANVAVVKENGAPVAVNDAYTTQKDTALSVAAPGVLGNDTDPDRNPITAILASGVAHGKLTLNADGSFIYTPASNYSGSDSFVYRVNDGKTNSANAATVTITVTRANVAPVAVGDSYSTAKDKALTVSAPGALGNDTDADGDPLTAVLVTDVSSGTLALSANGSFVYTPASGFVGTDTFGYKANDGIANSNLAAVVTIVVSRANALPVANNDSYSTQYGTALSVPASGVLGNDTDADVNVLHAVLVGNASHGTVTLETNGAFVYTPASGYSGTDSFTYKANDGFGDSNVATATITVAPPTPCTAPPAAVSDNYTAAEDTLLSISASGVLQNDTVCGGRTLTASLVSDVAHGTLDLKSNGAFVYTPAANFSGNDSFTYKGSDGAQNSNVVTVTISITPVNDLPLALNDAYTVTAGKTLTVPVASGVLANDKDVDGPALTAVLVANVSSGVLKLETNGSFTYTPGPSASGSDSFTYRANDGTGMSSVATVTITIDPGTVVNRPPIAVNDGPSGYTVEKDKVLTIAAASGVLANDSDPDGNSLTAIRATDAAHGTAVLASNGGFTYTPAAGYVGPDSFTYWANDGIAKSVVAATVSITVTNPVTILKPVITNMNSPVKKGALLTITGKNFGAARNLSKVKIAGKAVPVLRIKTWSDTKITLNVPAYGLTWFQGNATRTVNVVVSVKPDAATAAVVSVPMPLTVQK